MSDFLYRGSPGERGAVGWALAGIAVLVIAVVVIVGLYVSPPGRETYRIAMTETGGIRVGTEVRTAGILVGSVTAVDLADDHVDVSVSIDRSVFVGDQTSVQVRMLTIVGGVFVALLPSGRESLGDRRIPASRVSVPYTMSSLLDESSAAAAEVDTSVVRDSMTGLTDALREAPGSGQQILKGIESLSAVIDHQQDQLKSLVAVSSEYTDRIDAQRDLVERLIDSARSVFPMIVGYRDKSVAMTHSLAVTTDYVGWVLGEPYQAHVKPYLQDILASADQGQRLAEQISEQVEKLRGLLDRAARYVDESGVHLDAGQRLIDAKTVCIPVPGRSC